MSGKQQLLIHVAEITIFSISLALLYKKISNVSDRVDIHEKKLDEIISRLDMLSKPRTFPSQLQPSPQPQQIPLPPQPIPPQPYQPPRVAQPTPPTTPKKVMSVVFDYTNPPELQRQTTELATIEEVEGNEKNLDEELTEEIKDLI